MINSNKEEAIIRILKLERTTIEPRIQRGTTLLLAQFLKLFIS